MSGVPSSAGPEWHAIQNSTTIATGTTQNECGCNAKKKYPDDPLLTGESNTPIAEIPMIGGVSRLLTRPIQFLFGTLGARGSSAQTTLSVFARVPSSAAEAIEQAAHELSAVETKG
jgi:hypothetical protein